MPPAHLSYIALSIGELKHSTPNFIINAITEHLLGLSTDLTTAESIELRQAFAS